MIKAYIIFLFPAFFIFRQLVKIHYADKMPHSKTFWTVEETLEYFYTLSDDEECMNNYQLPPEKGEYFTNKENINEDTFESVL